MPTTGKTRHRSAIHRPGACPPSRACAGPCGPQCRSSSRCALRAFHAVLRAMMQHAVDDDPQVIPANPYTRIKKGVSRPVGRVLCSRSRGAAVIHLGLPLPTASCGLPASIGRAALDRSRREPLVPLLTLLRVGFTKPPQSPAALVVSYTAVSPLPRVPDAGRSVFCGTVPRVTPGRRYRPPCPVEPGPSSPGLRPARPPGRLTHTQDTPNAVGPV